MTEGTPKPGPRLEQQQQRSEQARAADRVENLRNYGADKKKTAETVRDEFPETPGIFQIIANLFRGKKG